MWKENTKCSCYNYHGSETSGVGNLDAILCWFPHIVLSFLAVSVVGNIAGQHPATYGLSFGGNYICSGFCQTLCPVKTIMKVGLHLYSPFSNGEVDQNLYSNFPDLAHIRVYCQPCCCPGIDVILSFNLNISVLIKWEYLSFNAF